VRGKAEDKLAQVQRLDGEREAATEGEELRGQLCREPRRLHDGEEPLLARFVVKTRIDELALSQERRHEVVELVGDAVGKPAQRLGLT